MKGGATPSQPPAPQATLGIPPELGMRIGMPTGGRRYSLPLGERHRIMTRAVRGGRLHAVVFGFDDRDYALGVEHVTEVIRMVALTDVPESPAWLLGALNLRGRIVPVIDLRAKLGLPRREPDLRTPIIIAEVGARMCGLVVDTVFGLQSLSIESLAHSGGLDAADGESTVVAGVATSGDRMIVVLDAEQLVCGPERFVSTRS